MNFREESFQTPKETSLKDRPMYKRKMSNCGPNPIIIELQTRKTARNHLLFPMAKTSTCCNQDQARRIRKEAGESWQEAGRSTAAWWESADEDKLEMEEDAKTATRQPDLVPPGGDRSMWSERRSERSGRGTVGRSPEVPVGREGKEDTAAEDGGYQPREP